MTLGGVEAGTPQPPLSERRLCSSRLDDEIGLHYCRAVMKQNNSHFRCAIVVDIDVENESASRIDGLTDVADGKCVVTERIDNKSSHAI